MAYGGRPFVLPDPIPELPAGVAPDGAAGKLQVLFICTYASDEPYSAVVQAAGAFIDQAQIYITGRLKPQDEDCDSPRHPTSRSPGSCRRIVSSDCFTPPMS